VLNNPSFPLIRYQIGDATRTPLELPARGFARLDNVLGRHNDFLLSRSGRRIHAAYVIETLKHAGEIGRYRVHQTEQGSLHVELELRDSPPCMDVDRVAEKLSQALDGYQVCIQIVDSVPPSPSGKHRWIVSDLAAIAADDGDRPSREYACHT
jgi:phenylacetate-CoA ligase